MNNGTTIISIFLLLFTNTAVYPQQLSEQTATTFEKVENLQLENRSAEALALLEDAIRDSKNKPDDLAHLYAHQSGMYVAMDSLLLGKELLDLSMEHARSNRAKAAAYRAKAFLNNYLNNPDEVVKDAITGLKFLADDDDEAMTKYHLNYLLYSAYSKWDDREKMEKYIRECEVYALRTGKPNLLANVNNGISSMFLAEYKKSNAKHVLDSMHYYLKKSFSIQQENPEKVSGNTFTITCINLANYFLEYADAPIGERKRQAYFYLDRAEMELKGNRASADKWVNIFGIKSGFAGNEGNILQAEEYLLQGLSLIQQDSKSYFKQEYSLFTELANIAVKRNDFKTAFNYQRIAETKLKQILDGQQIFNTQKLEIQYETEKKDQQLKLLNEREEFRKRQNYLYGGIAVALLFGLVFMFSSYHFRLRYSIERQNKLTQEKEDAEHHAAMQLQIEKEEQARLKAEQELSDLKRQQLEKEALANSLIIDHKNDMLKQIQDKIQEGDAGNVQKLLKKEMLMREDFGDIKMQIQELHPNFFNLLSEKAVQKLTALDLKYCAYIHLQMTTKQIAQVLHIAPQSVRMFKYRLKQKFGLAKESDLEVFLRELDANP